MINLKELRKLAMEATHGPWFVHPGFSGVNNKGEKYYKESFVACGDPTDDSANFEVASTDLQDEDTAFIAAANPEVILELLDLIEELQNKAASHLKYEE